MIESQPVCKLDDEGLIGRAGEGDPPRSPSCSAVTARLRQMVRLRLDRRLQGRVDASDVLQEAYLDVAQQLPQLSGQA